MTMIVQKELDEIIENEWKIFNKKNTPLKTNLIKSNVCDDYDRIWVSTEKGVVSFDGHRWEKHKHENKKTSINNLFIDAFDNKWICTTTKLVVYNSEGVEFKNNNINKNNVVVSK